LIKILVLDDELGVCRQLTDFLAYRGYRVFGVTSGDEALGVLESERPQILLLDIKMPGVNGLDVLRRAKALDPDTRVIMITALEDRQKREEALNLGADRYLVKPFDLEILENMVIKMVNEIIEEGGS